MDVGQGREQDAASFAALVKGITINCGLRLVLGYLGGSEIHDQSRALH
jgi:hypothetical protein